MTISRMTKGDPTLGWRVLPQLTPQSESCSSLIDEQEGPKAEVKAGQLDIDSIDENLITRQLDTDGLADVDLMIRTGGDMRVSNFLLWQISYAELWFTEHCWPDFSEQDFRDAIESFSTRSRRFGGLDSDTGPK